MAIRTMSLGEALDKGYEVIGAPQPQRGDPTLWETANIIGREILPAIGGSILGSIGGPKGIALGGAAGASIGNYWSQNYRIERGLQKRIGYGELGAATAMGAVPLSALPGKGALARTAIRGVEGSALATGELAARTYLDEGRAPTSDEVATTLLFGATLGGGLGALEAKWLNSKLGLDAEPGMTRPDTLKLLENKVKDVGGAANFETISPTGFFTFRDPRGNFTFRDPDVSAPVVRDENELGPRRLQVLDQQALPGPSGLPGTRQAGIEAPKTGSDVVIDIEAMDVKDYAEGVLLGLENKLMQETDDMVRGLAKSEQVAPEFQPIKEAFEKKIASDNELFTGINPIVAKGNLADNKRLREIDAEIEEMFATTSAKNRKKEGKLEKRIERLEDDLRWASSEVLTNEEIAKYHNSIWELITKGERNMAIDMLSSLNNQEVYDGILGMVADAPNMPIGFFDELIALGAKKTKTPLVGYKEMVELKGQKTTVGKDPTSIELFGGKWLNLRSAKEDLANMRHQQGATKTHTAAQKAKIAKLEKERERLQLKHGIIQVRGGAAGLAVGGTALTQAEEEELREIGPWALGLGMFAAATTGRKPGFIARLLGKGKKQADNEIAEAAKTGKPLPPVEPTKSVKVKDPNKVKDMRSLHFPQLIAILNNKSKKQLDLLTVDMAVRELAKRAAQDSDTARRLQKTMEDLVSEGQSRNTKVTVGELGRERLKRSIDPDVQTEASLPPGQGRGYLPGERKQVVGNMDKFELLEAIEKNDLNTPAAIQEALDRAAKTPKTKRFFLEHKPNLFPAILLGSASLASVSDLSAAEDDSEIQRSGYGGTLMFLLATALGYRGYKKFLKTKQGKQLAATAKLKPQNVEPDVIKSKRINEASDKAANMYIAPTEFAKTMRGLKEFTNFILVPLSRNLKNIDESLAREFRKFEKKIRDNTKVYLDRSAPFVTEMTKILRPKVLKRLAGEKGNPELFQRFKFLLLNGKYSAKADGEDSLTIMLDEMVTSGIIGVGKRDALSKNMKEMQNALEDIRTYAREEGGVNVGYLEDYFPRNVKDYPSFKKYLDETLDQDSRLRTEIEKALDEYASKYNLPSRDLIPNDEAAEVVSRVLQGHPKQPGASLPGSFKERSIDQITADMLDAYADPADALKLYVERAVDAVERRKFLGKKPPEAKTIKGEGFTDTLGGDLGIKMDVDDSLAGTVAKRLIKENNLSDADTVKLKEIIQQRFSGKTVDPWVQNVKGVNYMQVMGNFGSAITQLAELAYAFHFHGFGNTFHSLFNRKENFNFTKLFGLQDHHIDAQTSAGGVMKVLDNVFGMVGLKKLDQLSKNTIMNASLKKYRKQALSKNGSKKLFEELAPAFGVEDSRKMIADLINIKPGSKQLPKNVEELVFYKFLDMNPAALIEMPAGYTSAGNARILYMLKSFTIKQFDVYREAAGKDINKAFDARQKGDMKAALKFATSGIGKLTALATVFAAANASTDVLKDTLYGRPTKLDELTTNNLYRLLGISRYLSYKAKREGVARTALEMALPPTAVFDRAYQDIYNLYDGGEYKGTMLQGTPLDMVYWRYLGGLDKIKE